MCKVTQVFRFRAAHLRVVFLLYRGTKSMESNVSFPFQGCTFMGNFVAASIFKV